MSKGIILEAVLLAMRLFWALKNLALPKSGGKGNAEEQNSPGLTLWWETWTLGNTSGPVLNGPLTLPHAPQKNNFTQFRKTKIESHFPSHRNKHQIPRANNEATVVGKVECWSGTITPKSNKWVVVALENKALMDPRRVFRHINKLRFPQMHITQEYYSTVQSVWILEAEGVFVLTLKRKLLGLSLIFEGVSSSKTTSHLNQRPWCANHTNWMKLSQKESLIWTPSPTAKPWFGTSDS